MLRYRMIDLFCRESDSLQSFQQGRTTSNTAGGIQMETSLGLRIQALKNKMRAASLRGIALLSLLYSGFQNVQGNSY